MTYPCELTPDEKRGHVQFLADAIHTKINDLASTNPDRAYKMGLEFYGNLSFWVESNVNGKKDEPCITTMPTNI